MAATRDRSLTRRVAVDGIEVGFIDSGPDDSPAPPIVLLHGTGGSAAKHYGFLLPMLAAEHRVIAIDFARPATNRDALTVEQLAAQVQSVVRQLAPGRPVTLCGYSLGAVVAAVVAALHADLVANLVLIAGWQKTDAQQALRNAVWRTLRDEDSKALRDYMAFCAYGGPYLAARTPAEIEAIIDRIELSDFLDLQMDLNRRIDITALTDQIDVPTLVIGGIHDQMVPIRHSQQLFGAIRDARFTQIAAGHTITFERPAELFHLIDSFSAEPARIPAGRIFALPAP